MTPRRSGTDRRSLFRRRFLGRRLSRRWRWAMRIAIAVPLLLLGALVVFTQTPLLKAAVIPPVERRLGLELSADRVRVGRTGRLIMENVEARAPGVEGPAGLVLRVSRLSAVLDWGSLLSGSPRVTRVDLASPVVRVSQAVEDGTFNLAAISPPPRRPGAPGARAPAELPEVVGQHITLELGEHRGRVYTPLKRLDLHGALTPRWRDDGLPGYAIKLREANPRRPAEPLILDGWFITGDSVDIVLTGLSLDDWPPETVPTAVRASLRELDIEPDLGGEVALATFRVRDGRWDSASLELRDVALSLPLRPKDPEAGDAPMRMRAVRGRIDFSPAGVEARVAGLVEDFPYHVTLRYHGLDEDAPFRVELITSDFHIDKNPDLLPFAPRVVRKRFHQFSNPTLVLSARLVATRGPPAGGEPAPIRFSGLIDFRNGEAAYEKFPYPVHQLSGTVRFDENEIEVVRIAGVAPTGARVLATGRIAPPVDDAEATFDILITNVPFDDAVRDALGVKYGELMPTLFNEEAYERLLGLGLIHTEAQALGLRRALDDLRAGGASPEEIAAVQDQIRPVFELGGRGEVTIHLHSPYGKDQPWYNDVEVRIPRAGVLLEHFPFPVIAENVVLRIDDERARLVGGTFRGLGGGAADISLTGLLHHPDTGAHDFRPDIHVSATDIPLGPLLINALPRGAGEGDGAPVHELLHALGPAGRAGGTAHIAHRDGGELGFDVEVRLPGVSLAPPNSGGPARVAMDNIVGRIDVNERAMDLHISGFLEDLAAVDPDLVGPPSPSGRLAIKARTEWAHDDEAGLHAFDATIRATRLDLKAAFEDLVRPFSAETAEELGAVRDRFAPSGRVSAITNVSGGASAGTAASVSLTETALLGVETAAGPVTLGSSRGRAVLHSAASGAAWLKFEDFSAPLAHRGGPAGRLSLDGVYALRGRPATDLRAHLAGGRLESSLTNALVRKLGSETIDDWWARAEPGGEYDARIRIAAPGGPAEPPPEPEITGEIHPRSLTFTSAARGEQPALRVRAPEVGGLIRFGPGGGAAERLVATAEDWTLGVRATWTGRPGEDLSAAGAFTFDAASLTPEIRSLLPIAVVEAIDAIELRVDGPLSIDNTSFSYARRAGDDPTDRTGELRARLLVQNTSLEAGLPIQYATGVVDLDVLQPRGDAAVRYRLGVESPQLWAAGVQVSHARAVVEGGREPGRVEVRDIAAHSHGGRLSGDARVWLAGDGAEAPTRYATAFQWSGVRFSPVLADVAAAERGPSDVGPPPPPAVPDPRAEDRSRGEMSGTISLAGVVGDASSRRGRASLTVEGGRVLRLPLMLPLIEASNLALPFNAPLDLARAAAFIDGDRIIFERLTISSASVSIMGEGMMTWPSLALDMVFWSHSERPIPLLSRLVEAVRNDVLVTRVTGTVREPFVDLESLPSARRWLNRVAAGAPATSDPDRPHGPLSGDSIRPRPMSPAADRPIPGRRGALDRKD